METLQNVMNNEVLPEPYYALAEPIAGEAVPDVLTLQSHSNFSGEGRIAPGTIAAESLLDDSKEAAVALAPCPVIIKDLSLEPYDMLARRIAIHSEWEGDAVVAVLELVSRANKSSREKAERFLSKGMSFLEKGVHLLIIDLQRATPIVPAGFHAKICEQCGETLSEGQLERPLSAASFQVLESGKVRSHVAALKVGDVLPEMPIFLLPHRFVRLPLEKTYAQAFESLPRKFRGVLAGSH